MSLTFRTSGEGLWSRKAKDVEIRRISLESNVMLDDNGKLFKYDEIKVYFDKKSWNVKRLGLIYTDELFLKEVENFMSEHGLCIRHCKLIDYTEQGMQGDDYVSLEITNKATKAQRQSIVKWFTKELAHD